MTVFSLTKAQKLFTCIVFSLLTKKREKLQHHYVILNDIFQGVYGYVFVFSDDIGLFPNILNLATRSTVSVNATCGEEKSEVFCKLVDHVKIFPYKNSHCDICDARSRDERQRHPITNAINGRNSWWQSPTLTNGAKFNYVTITLDLKQV